MPFPSAIVLGGSGSVGGALLRELFRDEGFDTVITLTAIVARGGRDGTCCRPQTGGVPRACRDISG